MKNTKVRRAVLGLMVMGLAAMGGTARYVVPPGTPGVVPGGGFTDWSIAGTTIQQVVNGSVATDRIIVSNGTYTLTSEIQVDSKAVTLEPFGGEVVVDGNYPVTTNRCLYLNDAGAVVSGITFKNGFGVTSSRGGYGGGVYLNAGVLSNCTVVMNVATSMAGGVYVSSAGIVRGGSVSSNKAWSSGGGISLAGGQVYGVTLVSNACYNGAGGGGLYTGTAGGVASNCTAVLNQAWGGTDGAGLMSRGGTLVDCLASNNYSAHYGGGMQVEFAGSTALNCRVVNNIAGINGGGLGMGGGSLVSNMTIVGNAATNVSASFGGGGVYIVGGRLAASQVSSNWTTGVGGGIFSDTASSVLDCTVASNNAVSGGGGFYAKSAGLLVSGCLVSSNACTGGGTLGGGLYAVGGVTVTVSTFTYNTAPNKGGGMSIGGTCRVLNSTIGPGNSADDGGGVSFASGGVVSNCTLVGNISRVGDGGGGFWCITYGEIYDSSLISNKTSRNGGAAFCRNGTIMRNCLVAGNQATNTNYRGGGLYLDAIGVNAGRIESCTIAGNRGYYQGGGVYLINVNNALTNCIVFSNTVLSGADVDMYAAAAGDTNAPAWCCSSVTWLPPNKGNISGDPLFVNAAAADYRLLSASPCINKGINLDWMATAKDLDNAARISPKTGQVDMGAYERFIAVGSVITIR